VIAEPDVALTDFALAVEAGWLGALVFRRGAPTPARRWWTAFFWSVGAGALLGGVSHGFMPPPYGVAGAVLWRVTLLTIGAATLSVWGAGALALGGRAVPAIVTVASVLFAGYTAVVLLVTDVFAIVIAHYAPAALFLFGVLVRAWRRTRAPAALAGVLGLLVLAAGSLVQWARLGIAPLHLTHNAVYHLFEMLALVLLCKAARWLSTR
jgi:uncharacterized protein DUF6962